MEIIESQRVKRLDTKAPRKNDVVALRKKSSKLQGCTSVSVCIPWEQKRKEIEGPVENEEIFSRVWQENESLAHTFIWHCLVSF